MEVNVIPLVPHAVVPVVASPSTRTAVPSGYGVQEQCFPFTAASALGLLVRSPITFGYCRPDQVPSLMHGCRSPLRGDPKACPPDERVFYVADDPSCHFVRNAFTYVPLPAKGGPPAASFSPGLSFFDRLDQIDLVKLHLPYLCHTESGVDTLFIPPVNRTSPFQVLSGLVETDWYASPINLILRPHNTVDAVHVTKGDVLAQLVFVARAHRRPSMTVLADHSRLSRDIKQSMNEWLKLHATDRSAYKKLVRSRHGEFPAPK
jgi:hypothetical protein